jgi:hypothetical protein
LLFHQNGTEINAPRIRDKVSEKKEIGVPPGILTQYTGIYELGPGFDLVVTMEGNQLMTQAMGQQRIPIFAENETRFFPKVIEAEIEFVKDDKGSATHLVLRQDVLETKAPKK